jgi:hypothetical protein
MSLDISPYYQTVNRAQPDLLTLGAQCGDKNGHGRLVAGVGQQVHGFSERVGQASVSAGEIGHNSKAGKIAPICLIGASKETCIAEAAHPAESLQAWQPQKTGRDAISRCKWPRTPQD